MNSEDKVIIDYLNKNADWEIHLIGGHYYFWNEKLGHSIMITRGSEENRKKLIDKLGYNHPEQNQKELERFRKIYPLFKFELEENHLTVKMSNSSSFSTRIENGRVDHESTRQIDHDHMCKSMGQDLMKQYPDLYISVYGGKDGCLTSIWVNRPNDKGEADDAEGMGSISLTSPKFQETLIECQKEAKQAKQEGWFLCSGHGKAEPISEYNYFYFAGKYCKKYGDEYPEHRKAAGRETYN